MKKLFFVLSWVLANLSVFGAAQNTYVEDKPWEVVMETASGSTYYYGSNALPNCEPYLTSVNTAWHWEENVGGGYFFALKGEDGTLLAAERASFWLFMVLGSSIIIHLPRKAFAWPGATDLSGARRSRMP